MSATNQMNHKCCVCKEPAAGFHFGAFTCEGCKSFFGRTYNNQDSVPKCKNNDNCEINKKNRTSCKACRLKKCILAGMSKSSSRYGRRSNSFKEWYSLQEQEEGYKTNERSHSLPFEFYSPTLLPQSSVVFDDKGDAASTQRNSANANNAANSHNNEFYSWQHILTQQQIIAILNKVKSSSADKPIQTSPITQPYSLDPYQLLAESTPKITSDSDDNSDMESKGSSNGISPAFIHKIDEPTLSKSTTLINDSILIDARVSCLSNLSTSSFDTRAARLAKNDDFSLTSNISPNTPADKPIDLSIRASSSSSQFNKSSENRKKRKKEDEISDSDSSSAKQKIDDNYIACSNIKTCSKKKQF